MSQGSWSMLKLWKTYVKVKIHELAKCSTTSCWWYNSFFLNQEKLLQQQYCQKIKATKIRKWTLKKKEKGDLWSRWWMDRTETYMKERCLLYRRPTRDNFPNVSSFCRWLLQAERHHACLNPVKPAERKTSANLVWFSSHTHRHFFEVLLGMCDMMIR